MQRFKFGDATRDVADRQLGLVNLALCFGAGLLHRVIDAEQECADSSICDIALQTLDLYNQQPDAESAYEFEGNCIITLQDSVVFPACTP